MTKRLRKFLIKVLSKLVRVEVKPTGEIVLKSDEVKFISPFTAEDVFNESESLETFIQNLKK